MLIVEDTNEVLRALIALSGIRCARRAPWVPASTGE